MRKMSDLGNIKRVCANSVEQEFLEKIVSSSEKPNKKDFYKKVNEASVVDIVFSFENIDISSVIIREEPDFLLNETIAIEIRKVECKCDEAKYNKNNQYARWGKVREICNQCEKELDVSIYGSKNIFVKTLPKLFDLERSIDFNTVKKDLISAIMGSKVSNDYWADVEFLPKCDFVPQDNIMPRPSIFLHGFLPIEQLTVDHIKECIRGKEKKLPKYKHQLSNDGYSPTQYWLILDIPNDFIANYNFKEFSVQSNFDRIYLVDIYYKQQILRLK